MKSSNALLKKFENEKYDIVVLAGQSNAHGHGLGPVENEFVPDERISLLTDDADICFKKDENGQDYLYLPEKCKKHISIATEFGTPENKTGNFALIFAKKYLERGLLKEGRKLLILRAAVGGTGFARCCLPCLFSSSPSSVQWRSNLRNPPLIWQVLTMPIRRSSRA